MAIETICHHMNTPTNQSTTTYILSKKTAFSELLPKKYINLILNESTQTNVRTFLCNKNA